MLETMIRESICIPPYVDMVKLQQELLGNHLSVLHLLCVISVCFQLCSKLIVLPLLHNNKLPRVDVTNIVFKQKLPNRVVPEEMEEYGAITIVCHPHSTVSSTYTISDIDGHVCVNKWNEFMKKEKLLLLGQKVLMLLYLGDHGIYLFVSHVPDVPLEQFWQNVV